MSQISLANLYRPNGKMCEYYFDLTRLYKKIWNILFVDGEFEPLDITAYSPPPELPDVMKPQETGHVSAAGENQAS